MSKMSGFKKPRKFSFVCVYCKDLYFSADVKARFCKRCMSKIEVTCRCGCKKKFLRLRWLVDRGRTFWTNHEKRGLSYLQIYGTLSPGCGFKRGELNIAKDPMVREKISGAVVRSYTPQLLKLRSDAAKLKFRYQAASWVRVSNSHGESFQSSLEMRMAEVLRGSGLKYKTQIRVPMIGDRVKIVDFMVGHTLIEVSGFAYSSWRADFTEKIGVLRRSVENPIVIATYPENVPLLRDLCSVDVFPVSIFDTVRIISLINFTEHTIVAVREKLADGYNPPQNRTRLWSYPA